MTRSKRRILLALMCGLSLILLVPLARSYQHEQEQQEKNAGLIRAANLGNAADLQALLAWGAIPNAHDLPDPAVTAPSAWSNSVK